MLFLFMYRKLLYAYKFSYVIFVDGLAIFRIFRLICSHILRTSYFSPSVVIVKHRIYPYILKPEDENYGENQITMKSTKIIFFEILYAWNTIHFVSDTEVLLSVIIFQWLQYILTSAASSHN